MRDWVANARTSHYLLGSAVGPHPYPLIVRQFQSVIGKEVKRQIRKYEGRYPDYLVACVGGGSNAIGLFYPFLKEKQVKMIAVEAAGQGEHTPYHALSLLRAKKEFCMALLLIFFRMKTDRSLILIPSRLDWTIPEWDRRLLF